MASTNIPIYAAVEDVTVIPKAVPVATKRLNELIKQRDEIQKQIDGLQASNGQVQGFLDSLDGQIGPYAMQSPDVYAALIGAWETYKASNPV